MIARNNLSPSDHNRIVAARIIVHERETVTSEQGVIIIARNFDKEERGSFFYNIYAFVIKIEGRNYPSDFEILKKYEEEKGVKIEAEQIMIVKADEHGNVYKNWEE